LRVQLERTCLRLQRVQLARAASERAARAGDLYIRPCGGTSTETSYHTLKYLYNLQSTKIDEM